MNIKLNGKLAIALTVAIGFLAAFGANFVGTNISAAASDNSAQRAKFAAENFDDKKLSSAETLGTYAIDPNHSEIGFRVRHLGIADVLGEFTDYSGTIYYNADDIKQSKVEFTAKIAGISTGVKQRDDHLRTADFFDAEKFPELSFRSKRIEPGKEKNQFVAVGDFTLKGVTKEMRLPVEFYGVIRDQYKQTRMGAAARLEINRQDYGVKWSATLDNGSLAVDNTVRVELQIEAVKQEPKEAAK